MLIYRRILFTYAKRAKEINTSGRLEGIKNDWGNGTRPDPLFSTGAYTASDKRPVEKKRSGHARLALAVAPEQSEGTTKGLRVINFVVPFLGHRHVLVPVAAAVATKHFENVGVISSNNGLLYLMPTDNQCNRRSRHLSYIRDTPLVLYCLRGKDL